MRWFLYLIAAALGTFILGGCAAPPIRAPESVAVNTRAFSRDYSSFNARVLDSAGALDASFRTSLKPDAEAATRLESAYTYQFDGSREQLRVGDTISSTGMWGSAVRYGGMQYGTNAARRSDLIATSDLATSGVAVLPTVSDALFNMAGDPGASFARRDLSVSRAWRTGDLVARDALGRSVAISAPLIGSTRLAQPGCGDVSVGAGRVREDYAITSNQYGATFANTTIACGLPLGFTVEGHGEYLADDVTAVGVGVARRLGPLGIASLAYASSYGAEGSGWLARVGFERQGDLFSMALRSRVQSRDFRNVGDIVADDPIMQRDLATVGVNVIEGARLSVAYATQVTWSRERMNFIALQQSLNVGRGSLSMSAGRSLADDYGSTVFLSYKRPFGFGLRPAPSMIEEFIPLLPGNTSGID